MRIISKFLFYLSISLMISSCSINVPSEVEVEFSNLPETIDYNYDVKPILSDRCYQCHGPDEKTRKAGLRPDIEEIAFSKLQSGNQAFSSGSTYGSEAAHRILSSDPDQMMPTPESKLSLSNKEKAIILKWIEQGAIWKEHWSFLPVKKPKLPTFDPMAVIIPIIEI